MNCRSTTAALSANEWTIAEPLAQINFWHNMEQMAPVFVSYSNADRPQVDAICQFLESAGIACWIAHRDEPVGRGFEQPIVDAIQKSPACLFVLTRSANQSRHVANEVSVAFKAGRPLVPFRLDHFALSGDLLYYLDRIQAIDATSGLDRSTLGRLTETLRRHVDIAASAQGGHACDEFKELEVAAAHGNTAAQFSLALRYSDPSSAKFKPGEAVKWFRSAAENGHAEGARRIAMAYWAGEGVLRNEPEAIRWFRTAAALGDTQAATMWGRILLAGNHTTKDPLEAAAWFAKAAANGDLDAAFQLALLYVEGLGVERNDGKAVEALRRCAEAGNPDAQFRLAWMISQGRDPIADPAEALPWAERAASQGHETARRLLFQLNSGS